jgi:division protein CdvB (Snf7/Vps24/ESCRT-III family)
MLNDSIKCAVLIILGEIHLSKRFAEKWGEADEPQARFGTRVKQAVRSSSQLRPRLDFAINRLENQIQRLDQTGNRLSQRDKSVFAKVVESYSKHDQQHANAFANELTEIRKTEMTVMNVKLALEQIVLRLKTVTEVGDMVSTIAPVISVLGNVRKAITGVLPDAGKELEQIGTELNGIITDAGQTTGLTLDFSATNEEAQKILTEAATVAEERTKQKLPELPALGQKPQTKT